MAFSEYTSKINVVGFNTADKATVLAAMKTAYDGSATVQAMYTSWFTNPAHTIEVDYVAGKFQAYTSTGHIEIDPSYLPGLQYISATGVGVQHTLVDAITHELGHALTGRADTITNTDYQGPNVTFINQAFQELGLPKEISYVAQAREDVIHPGFQYTNGATIDSAYVDLGNKGGADRDTSTLGTSRDLLIGGDADNRLYAGAGNDFLVGGGGNDTLDGGAGTDTVVYYDANPLDFDVRRNSDGSWTVDHVRGAANEGTDHLTNIENIRFGDGPSAKTYALTNGGLTYQNDFALVIDTTGSMGSTIGSVKAQAVDLINAAFGSGTKDARIGIVGFKDTTDGEPSSIILPFTDQTSFADRQSAAVAAINSIGVGGGGDLPETDFDGLKLALDGSMGAWRPGAGTLRIALFTDAPAKDGDLLPTVAALAASIGATVAVHTSVAGARGSVDSFSLSYGSTGSKSGLTSTDDPDATDSSTFDPGNITPPEAGPSSVQVFTIFVGPAGTDTANLQEIASQTGGSYFDTAGDTNIADILFSIITSGGGTEYTFETMTQTNADALTTGDSITFSKAATTATSVKVTPYHDGEVSGVALSVGSTSLHFADTVSDVSTAGHLSFSDGSSLVVGTDSIGDVLVGKSTAEGPSGAIWGLGGDDTITTGAGADYVYGGLGADKIDAGNGNYHIFGNTAGGPNADDGDDTITTGAGNSYINGNAGNDTISVGTLESAGTNRVSGGQGDDTITILGGGSASVNGNKGADTIDASDSTGNNLLRGGRDNDTIHGGQGHDVLMGDAGDDTLIASSASGHITVMTGGTGADTFDFSTGGNAAAPVDYGSTTFYQEVTDFTHAVDKIQLSFAVADGDVITIAPSYRGGYPDLSEAQKFAQMTLDKHGVDDTVISVQVGTDTFLYYSYDNDGEINGVIKLDGVSANVITASDFKSSSLIVS